MTEIVSQLTTDAGRPRLALETAPGVRITNRFSMSGSGDYASTEERTGSFGVADHAGAMEESAFGVPDIGSLRSCNELGECLTLIAPVGQMRLLHSYAAETLGIPQLNRTRYLIFSGFVLFVSDCD